MISYVLTPQYYFQQMNCETEAIVDICLRFHRIRNLSDQFINRCFFKISLSVGNNLGLPYQIISGPSKTLSGISTSQYISPLFTLSPLSTYNHEELAVFKVNLSLQELSSAPMEIIFTLYELINEEEISLQTHKLDYISVTGTHGFMPICFSQVKCAIDASITTQLLSYRFRNFNMITKGILSNTLETLFISYNRLRGRINKIKDKWEQRYQSEEILKEFQQINKLAKKRIFQLSQTQLAQKTIQLQHKIPILTLCIQNIWTIFLLHELQSDFQLIRSNFLTNYALNLKHSIQNNDSKPDLRCIIDGLNMISYSIGMQIIQKKQAQNYHIGNPSKQNLFILVHGFGATGKTMENIQFLLRFFFPNLKIVTSKINQNKTEDDLQQLGRRLSVQIQAYINSLRLTEDFSLSFISHSLGGLIARSSLKHLSEYRYNMKTFISLATPHLGYLYHNSTLTSMGLQAYNFIKSTPSIATLLMKEKPDSRLTQLYCLSTAQGLNWFEEVAFYASRGDCYVSPQSALLITKEEIQQGLQNGSQTAKLWEQMRSNIQSKLQKVRVTKTLVDFQKENMMREGSILDQLLGRRDHINLATSKSFLIALIMIHFKDY